jgi:hypothetical protein
VTANHVRLIIVAVFAVAIMTPAALITARELGANDDRPPDTNAVLEEAKSQGIIDRYEAVGGRRYIADGGDVALSYTGPRLVIRYRQSAADKAVAVLRIARRQGTTRIEFAPPTYP